MKQRADIEASEKATAIDRPYLDDRIAIKRSLTSLLKHTTNTNVNQ